MARLKKVQVDNAIDQSLKESRLWDDDPRGLGLRIKPNGSATFFIQYRSPVTQKKVRHSIGQYGRLTIGQARTKAKHLFEAITNGLDPAIEKRRAKFDADTALTVSDFCDNYMRDAEAGIVTYRGKPKKPSTLSIDFGRIERHIKPTLGTKLVQDVTSQDVERAMHDIRLGKTATDIKTRPRGRAIVTGGAGTAARTVKLLGSIFSYAIKKGILTENPAWGVQAPPDGRRTRVLSPKEYEDLGSALNSIESEGGNLTAIQAIRLLALTGCRRGEIYALKKKEVDEYRQCLRFSDTKTGQQVRPIGQVAMALLTSSLFVQDSNFVFPATRGDGHHTDTKLFHRTCLRAGLEDVTLHTLRHSFASTALELEYSEMTIAGLLGHRQHSITSRYTHHVDRALISAADSVSALVESRLSGTNIVRESEIISGDQNGI